MEPLLIALVPRRGVRRRPRRAWSQTQRIGDAEREAQRILEDARRQADAQVKEARVTAREELLAQRTEQERDLAERRAEIIKIEERMASSQSQLESALEELSRRDQSISDREVHAKQLQEELKNRPRRPGRRARGGGRDDRLPGPRHADGEGRGGVPHRHGQARAPDRGGGPA